MTIHEMHSSLVNDDAYQYSVEHNDIDNLMLVLRAYNYPFDVMSAINLLDYARGI